MRAIRLLIDGYNLLFQSPLVGRGQGAGWLPLARERLLKLLAEHLQADHQARTTVIFDAAKFGESPADFLFKNRIEVRFATEHQEADDLLEVLIRQAPQPKLLHVVSSDLRIRRCALARRANAIDAETFLRMLQAGLGDSLFNSQTDASAPQETDIPEKERGATDVDYWLREFDI
jgi:uncharacterized protein